jgi:AraC-like DNA-binding protein
MSHIHYHFESDKSKYDIFFQNRPRLLYTGLVTDVKNWFSEPNSHTFYELLYFYKGNGSIFTDGREYHVNPGKLVIYHPGVVHYEKSSPDDQFHFAFLAFEINKAFEDSLAFLPLRENGPIINSGQYRYHLEDKFSQLLNEAKSHIDGYQVMCDSLMASIIIEISRIEAANKSSQADSSETLKIKEFIDNNYTKDLNLDALSEIVYVSKHHLAHMFKNEIGVPPITYMINKRMDEAKRLLRETDLGIAEISSIIGYENQNYFSQLFKKMVSMSPMHYRQSHSSVN